MKIFCSPLSSSQSFLSRWSCPIQFLLLLCVSIVYRRPIDQLTKPAIKYMSLFCHSHWPNIKRYSSRGTMTNEHHNNEKTEDRERERERLEKNKKITSVIVLIQEWWMDVTERKRFFIHSVTSTTTKTKTKNNNNMSESMEMVMNFNFYFYSISREQERERGATETEMDEGNRPTLVLHIWI